MNVSTFQKYLRVIISEGTPRIQDLEYTDILNVLDDILGREPLLTFTEKLAGQFLDVKIENGWITANQKDGIKKGAPHSPKFDIGGVAKTLKYSNLMKRTNATYKFEVIKPENRPDYIDYVIGDIPIAIEFTGAMSKNLCMLLNTNQKYVKFLCKDDIIKRPKPLPPELRQKIQHARDNLASSPKITKAMKVETEMLVSRYFLEIFGESTFGGSSEGVFATGASKDFKIPNITYADIQRIQAPIYSIFSEKSNYYTSEQIIERINGLVGNHDKLKSDKMLLEIHRYLKAASQGFEKGFRTFFNKNEATQLLNMMQNIADGDNGLVFEFYKTIKNRVNNMRLWVST